MHQSNRSLWQAQLKVALRQDPKKTGVLGVLAAVLLVMGGRLVLQNTHPAAAAGSFASISPVATSLYIPTPIARSSATSASLRDWLVSSLVPVSHNMFLMKPEYYPSDSAKPVTEIPDGGFWPDVEKSLSLQADQRDKRAGLIAALKEQAAAVRPQSTIMGEHPRAMINGVLVAQGEEIDSFRVLKIEQRGIIVERGGVRLAVPMK